MVDFFGVMLAVPLGLLLVDLVMRHPRIALRFYFGPAHFYYERNPLIPKTLRHTPKVDIRAGVTGNLSYILGRKRKDHPVRFATDQYGYRNLIAPHSPLPETLLLGNCFFNASKTDQDKILAARLAARGHQCYTIAVDSINLWEEVVNLKYHLATNPQLTAVKRVVWAVFEGNDLEGEFRPETEPAQVMAGLRKRLAVRLENYYKRSVLRRLFKILFARRKHHGMVLFRDFFGKEMLFFEPYVQMLSRTADEVRNHRNYRAVQQIFAVMAEEAAKRDMEVLCLFIPVKPRVYDWVLQGAEPWSLPVQRAAFADFVEDLCRQHGFSFLDSTPHLHHGAKEVYAERGEVLYWLDDTHWSHEGIDIAATLLDRYLPREKP